MVPSVLDCLPQEEVLAWGWRCCEEELRAVWESMALLIRILEGLNMGAHGI